MEFDTNFITNAGNPDPDTWAPVNGEVDGETGYAIRPITSGSGEEFDVDLDELDADEDDRYNQADWDAFAGTTGLTLVVGMNEDVDPTLDPLPDPQLNAGSGATVLGASLLGIGTSRRDVAVSMQGVALLAPGDTLSFVGYRDESGILANTAPVDAALIFADRLQPLIIQGATADNAAGEPDTIGLTLVEPPAQEGDGDATDINNWMYSAWNVLDAAVVTDSAVTITAGSVGDEDGQYTGIYEGFDKDTPGGGEPDYSDTGEFPPTNTMMNSIWDLNGNLSANTSLGFILVDGIAPRLDSTADAQTDSGGTPLNDGGSEWEVFTISGTTRQVTVRAVFTEPVVWDLTGDETLDVTDADGLGLDAQLNAEVLRYSNVVNDDPLNVTTPRFVFNILPDRTVEAGDTLQILQAADVTGNNVNLAFDEIVLGSTGGDGYDIE
jgi:hypothetical protein